jgi:FAD/FMN-containing dehydrogenase
VNAPPPPLKVTREAAALAYDSVARASNEVAGRLAQRLASETSGEVLFTPADRGRYATDASIYQVVPVGVFVPRTAADTCIALDICRDLKVPMVPRGGGTSQCGQTVGAGLVIDFSKHVCNVLDINVPQRIVTVEPGIVLDRLNAQLKKLKLWYPVDVSTAAQATLGGMAGNNSCGSRSIAYGNMVHNVLGAQAWTSDGVLHRFGRFEDSTGAARAMGERVRDLAQALRPEIEERWPKVLRRVGGYNLDVFHNQNERPYTGDGSVNLAHLLIGSEGTLALTKSLTLRLSELPRARVLGVVNFPTFHQAMDSAQHIVKLGGEGSLTAVELVDRTMIELSLQNPAFAPTVRSALIGSPDAVLLVEFAGSDKAQLLRKLAELQELMGDLGLPGSVVLMPDETAQKNLWEVRKAGLNIMMSLKGDGKPVSFIEDCAVPLEHLAEYTSALTEVFHRHETRGTWYAHASVGTLHVRPILDMRTNGAPRMREIAQEASALVRKFKGAYSGEHGDGLCRGEWIQWQFGPKIDAAFGEIKRLFEPAGDGRHAADALSAKLQGDPAGAGAGLERLGRAERPRHRTDHRAGHRRRPRQGIGQGGGDVQQQRPLPQVRRRHHVPELPRHARRAAPDARPRQHPAAGHERPARARWPGERASAAGAGPVRQLQGLQARLPDRRRHGPHEDRVPAC